MKFVTDNSIKHNQGSRRHIAALQPYLSREYRWQLGKPIAADVDFGEPAADDLGNGMTTANILATLNGPNPCFDFDYQPTNGDSLTLTHSYIPLPTKANDPYMEFVYWHGEWHVQDIIGLTQSFANGFVEI